MQPDRETAAGQEGANSRDSSDELHLQNTCKGAIISKDIVPLTPTPGPGSQQMRTAATERNVAWAKALLKSAGLRSTAARVAVLQRLAAAEQPVSHADVVDSLQNFGFDQSTIFRSLQELSEAGMVNRLDLGDQLRRFELRESIGDDAMEHPHFMCVDCGKVACLDDFSFRLSPSRGPRREQLGEITEVLLKGHCGDCRR